MIYEYDPYKTTTIRINKSDFNKIKEIAKEQRRSNNFIINQAIIRYITSGENESRDTISYDMYD